MHYQHNTVMYRILLTWCSRCTLVQASVICP